MQRLGCALALDAVSMASFLLRDSSDALCAVRARWRRDRHCIYLSRLHGMVGRGGAERRRISSMRTETISDPRMMGVHVLRQMPHASELATFSRRAPSTVSRVLELK